MRGTGGSGRLPAEDAGGGQYSAGQSKDQDSAGGQPEQMGREGRLLFNRPPHHRNSAQALAIRRPASAMISSEFAQLTRM